MANGAEEGKKGFYARIKEHLEMASIGKEAKYLMVLVSAFGSVTLLLAGLVIKNQNERDSNQERMIYNIEQRMNTLEDSVAHNSKIITQMEELNRRVTALEDYRNNHADISSQGLQRLAAIEALLKYQANK